MSQAPEISEAEKAPIAKLAEAIISQSLDDHATSFAVLPNDKEMRVFYTINDEPLEAMTVPKNLQVPLVNRFKIMANMDLDSHEAQTGRIKEFPFEDKTFEFDVVTEPTEFGEKVTLTLVA
ncbi:MAG: ATPase, T2SS/T4P/T4SS family [Patescibacteria group bacterium]